MRIIFIGSADFACASLKRLVSSGIAEVVTVITQPDRPSGRGLGVSSCPLKQCATNLHIPVLTPEKVKAADSIETMRALKPDLLVVVAYGQILSPAVLALPSLGCVNIHGSLLPKYRGAAPIQWAIASGEQVTGVTAMYMNEQMDAGDIILQREMIIASDDTAGSLHDKLAEQGADVLIEAMKTIQDGTAIRIPQAESEATCAPKLSKKDGRIDWTKPAVEIYNRIRGFNPWPGSFCEVAGGSGDESRGGLLLKILKAAVEDGHGNPGEVLSIDGTGPLVATGEEALRLIEVQPEGRKAMSGSAFLHGHGLKKGALVR
jgi:methionyl-tRNA formyltransferase